METGDSEERLLEGVTAYDGKDGDLTSKVFVESISNFVEPGVSNVTYVVYDADRHAAKASRKVVYLDYTPPRFVPVSYTHLFFVLSLLFYKNP